MAEAEKPKKSWAEKVTKGVVYAMLTGTAFYMVGAIADPYIAGAALDLVAAAIGATGAFAIAVFPSE